MRPARSGRLVAPARPGLDRSAQAHLPLQLLDLLDLLADLLFELGVDLFLDDPRRLGAEAAAEGFFFVEPDVFGVLDLVQVEFVDVAGLEILGRGSPRGNERGEFAFGGSRSSIVGRELVPGGRRRRLELRGVAIPATAAPPSPSLSLPGVRLVTRGRPSPRLVVRRQELG